MVGKRRKTRRSPAARDNHGTDRATTQGRELQGLAGLTRGWMYMAGDQIEQALVVLRSVRNVGGDLHQHHFIDMYIGLSLFRNGDLAAAASQWREAMRNALAVGHVRGAAGCIEGCGYIAERLGQPERACLCLGPQNRFVTVPGFHCSTFGSRTMTMRMSRRGRRSVPVATRRRFVEAQRVVKKTRSMSQRNGCRTSRGSPRDPRITLLTADRWDRSDDGSLRHVGRYRCRSGGP